MWINISTHALTEGDDQLFCNAEFSLISTHDLTEGDTGAYANSDMRTSFQLTPSRRATRFESSIFRFPVISTHALTEGDAHVVVTVFRCNISTHALTEGDSSRSSMLSSFTIFQLTPSRRATPGRRSDRRSGRYFNSRPHGGRPIAYRHTRTVPHFNSRPHGGRRYLPSGSFWNQ